MRPELRDPAQAHIDAIYRLNDHLLETCGDQFDREMEGHVRRLLLSFDAFRAGKALHPFPRDGLYDDSLGRNYLTAQCSAMLVFVNQVRVLAGAQGHDELRRHLAALDEELKARYVMFFKPPPHVPGK